MTPMPPLSQGPWADLPYKNSDDLPKEHELRATEIAALLQGFLIE